jgi:hypothetical protein
MRRVANVEVMGLGRYRVTIEEKRWWQRRWRTSVYDGIGTVWFKRDSVAGTRCSTNLEWYLTNVAVRFKRELAEVQRAGR